MNDSLSQLHCKQTFKPFYETNDPVYLKLNQEKANTFKFVPHRIGASRKVYNAAMYAQFNLMPYIERHLQGDWGSLIMDRDKIEQDKTFHALPQTSLMSAFLLPKPLNEHQAIWIYTDNARFISRILFPQEFYDAEAAEVKEKKLQAS